MTLRGAPRALFKKVIEGLFAHSDYSEMDSREKVRNLLEEILKEMVDDPT